MASGDEHKLLALLGLRLRGFAVAGAVAEVVGAPEADIAVALKAMVIDGLVRFNDERGVYLLDPASGRPEGERLLAAQLDAAGARADVGECYKQFLALNQPMLQLCTDWQIKTTGGEQILNNHDDADYDHSVIGRLVELDDSLRKILTRLRDTLDRYGAYVGRFRGALDKLLDGDLDYFTKPIVPSYHTVWFELHEDLLATLGIDRATEGST